MDPSPNLPVQRPDSQIHVVIRELADILKQEQLSGETDDPVRRYHLLMTVIKRELTIALGRPDPDPTGEMRPEEHADWLRDRRDLEWISESLPRLGIPRTPIIETRPFVDPQMVGYELLTDKGKKLGTCFKDDLPLMIREHTENLRRNAYTEQVRTLDTWHAKIRLALYHAGIITEKTELSQTLASYGEQRWEEATRREESQMQAERRLALPPESRRSVEELAEFDASDDGSTEEADSEYDT